MPDPVNASVDNDIVRLDTHPAGPPDTPRDRLAMLAPRCFMAFGLVLYTGGLLDLLRRGFDTSDLHGLRMATAFVTAGLLIRILHHHAIARRIVVDVGLLAAALVAANYARLAVKTWCATDLNPARFVLFGTLGAAGIICMLRIGLLRFDRAFRRGVCTRGVCGLAGAGLMATGLFVSAGFRSPQASVAAILEMSKLADQLDGSLREVLADPDRVKALLADPEIQKFAARLADDDRLAQHDDLREFARRLAEGQVDSLQGVIDNGAMKAARPLLHRFAQSPAAPDHDDSRARTIAVIRKRAAALTAEQLAQLHDIDLNDPRVQTAMKDNDIDPEIVEQLLADRAGALALIGPNAGEPARRAMSPAGSPPVRIKPRKAGRRIDHRIRHPRAHGASDHGTATGIRHVATLPTPPAPVDPPGAASPKTNEPAAPPPSAESTPEITAAAPPPTRPNGHGLDLPKIASILKTAMPPPPSEPPDPTELRRNHFGGTALLVLGVFAMGLALRKPRRGDSPSRGHRPARR